MLRSGDRDLLMVAIMGKKPSTSNETGSSIEQTTKRSSVANKKARKKTPRSTWVEVDSPDNGHGVSFYHESILDERGCKVCVAFLVGFGWQSRKPSTVLILARRPPSISSAHWSDLVKTIILSFWSSRGGIGEEQLGPFTTLMGG
jgi:hypothetical protein